METLVVQGEISSKILTLRGQEVMVDRDLAKLYGVPTKRLNEQVKRNLARFPRDFMFQLDEKEKNELVAKCDHLDSMKHSTVNPYVFTEQGIYMLASVLKSDTAIAVNIAIIRTFKKLREFIKGYPVVGVPLVGTLDVNIKMNYNIMQAKGNHKGLPLQVDNLFILGFLK